MLAVCSRLVTGWFSLGALGACLDREVGQTGRGSLPAENLFLPRLQRGPGLQPESGSGRGQEIASQEDSLSLDVALVSKSR